MPFEYGRISCRLFMVPRDFPDDAVARFAEEAAPSFEAARSTEYRGWVTGRHLLDRNINEDSAFFAGYLRLTLLDAQRKVPAALLQAECRMEELAQMAVDDSSTITRKKRMEIKREVTERLLPQMPPQLKGMPFVYDEQSRTLYCGALSIAQMDLFATYFTHTLGFSLIPSLPDTLAAARKKVEITDWHPTSFSPELDDDQADVLPGRDFLTWLWFVCETQGGNIHLPELGTIGVVLQGPLTFVHEGRGAHEITLRKGEPMFSTETTACLLAGKKLKRAKLTLGRGEQVWETNLDADEFTFRSLLLPEGEKLDPVSTFQERMRQLDTFREIFFALYDRFVDERSDRAAWKATRTRIHEWVREREQRK